MDGLRKEQDCAGWPSPFPAGVVSSETLEVIELLRRRYPAARAEVLPDDEDGYCWQIDLPADYRVILRADRIFLLHGPLTADPNQEDDLPIPDRLVRVESAEALKRLLP